MITYKIPNGTMRIGEVEFFSEAGIRKIRKMLEQLRQDRQAAEEYTPLIRGYLERQERAQRDRINNLNRDLAAVDALCSRAEARYREMQDPCYACYTQDEAKLAAARKAIRAAKAKYGYTKRQIAGAEKLAKRYKGIQEDVDKILGGCAEEENRRKKLN